MEATVRIFQPVYTCIRRAFFLAQLNDVGKMSFPDGESNPGRGGESAES